MNLFKRIMESEDDSTIGNVKRIIVAAEEIVDNAKIVLQSVIEMTDTFGSKYEKKDKAVGFGKPINNKLKGFSTKGPFSNGSAFDNTTEVTFGKKRTEFGLSKSRSILKLDDITNLADVLEFVAYEAEAPVTYGVKSIDENNATFILSSNLYIIENKHGDISLHVNVDAPAITVKRGSVQRIVGAFLALTNFVKACLEFTTADGVEASFSENALMIQLDDEMSINAGLVILMIKALKDSDAEHGFTFNVGDYRCKVSGSNLIVGKDGYNPASIPVDKFYFLHTNAPAFSDMEINDDDFRQYSDNPNELFVRMILELMKTHDSSLTMDDIKIIDNVAGTTIRTNTLGLELKKMR